MVLSFKMKTDNASNFVPNSNNASKVSFSSVKQYTEYLGSTLALVIDTLTRNTHRNKEFDTTTSPTLYNLYLSISYTKIHQTFDNENTHAMSGGIKKRLAFGTENNATDYMGVEVITDKSQN